MKIMNVYCDFSALFFDNRSLPFAAKRKVGHVRELITCKIFVQTSKFFLYFDARLSYIHLISIRNVKMNVWCDFLAVFVADGSLSFAVKRKVGHVRALLT